MQMFQYLLFTILLELPVVILCYHTQWKTVLLIDILLNFFTWPLLTLLYYNTHIPLLVLEDGVFITEALGFKIFFGGNWPKALLVSFTANALSLLAGVYISGISLF